MKNKLPITSGILFKAVISHLLLFSIFFAWNAPIFLAHEDSLMLFCIFYLFSLALTIWFSLRITFGLKQISDQIDDFTEKNYAVRKQIPGHTEINLLYEKVVNLGEKTEHAQETLESSSTRLNGILTYMTDGVIATDRRGKVVLANASALNYLNVKEKDILSRKIIDALDIASDYTFRELLESEPELIIDSQNAMGEFTTLRIKFALFRRESGFISGVVAVLHDVTEQEKNERERRLFVSNVSHELRTPLTSVKSYLETLDEGAITDSDLAPNFVKVSLKETDRMIRMIQDLVILSRMDSDKIVLEKEVINFVAFLHFQLNRFDQIVGHSDKNTKQFKIVRKIPLQPVWMEIDTDKMSQVIDNLMNNAIKYSPDGGKITVSLELTNTQVLLRISDEGIGIPKKDLPKIFDRFYRVDKARSREQGGSGLGLSIVRDIIKMHNGFVWAKSDGKTGTTFTIVLPYAPLGSDATSDVDDWSEEKQ
ncbi:PAS domain-containing sensor histidine kinase [Lactococcus hodotermopsidis]|uniref:histidine kinase n=1 Tax=Pseudolactococcus hodotermopsidis TaxID=2709157 RepID=A0A6A0BCF6_9LACT|nr:ATP-binding protein [Lactococcus hodotermopsidis]GFH43050.1 PAS domain-containing sensor histidine kinase [Lactococcus hodotermopsidis]